MVIFFKKKCKFNITILSDFLSELLCCCFPPIISKFTTCGVSLLFPIMGLADRVNASVQVMSDPVRAELL